MNASVVIAVIKKRRIKDVDKLIHHMKSNDEYADYTPAFIRKVFNKYNKQRAVKTYNKALMGNKFSAIPDAWQMDIFKIADVSRWLLCININTKYAWTHKLPGSKGAISVSELMPSLKKFVNENAPHIIECDEEKAFTSIEVANYLSEQGIILRLTPKKMHTYLSVINRLCRTLSDKVYYEDDVKEGDEDINDKPSDSIEIVEEEWDASDYDFDEHDVLEEDLYKLVDLYNATKNRAIGMTPNQMHNDKNAQMQWVYEQFMKRDAKEKLIQKEPLKLGDDVRYILDEDRGSKAFQKNQRRKQLSEDYFKIAKQVSPYLYEIMGRDGLTKPVPRYRLVKLSNTASKKWATSVNDEQDYLGEDFYYKIADYKCSKNPSLTSCKYIVKMARFSKDGRRFQISPKPVEVSVYQLRNRLKRHTSLTDLEKEFLSKHREEYMFDKSSTLLVPINE